MGEKLRKKAGLSELGLSPGLVTGELQIYVDLVSLSFLIFEKGAVAFELRAFLKNRRS